MTKRLHKGLCIGNEYFKGMAKYKNSKSIYFKKNAEERVIFPSCSHGSIFSLWLHFHRGKWSQTAKSFYFISFYTTMEILAQVIFHSFLIIKYLIKEHTQNNFLSRFFKTDLNFPVMLEIPSSTINF